MLLSYRSLAWLSQTGQSALCIFSASPQTWGRTLQELFWFIVSHNTGWQHHFSFPIFHCSFWALSSCGSSSTATCGATEAGWDLARHRMFHSCARLCRAGLPARAALPACATAAAFCTTLKSVWKLEAPWTPQQQLLGCTQGQTLLLRRDLSFISG